jgi:hypothetical protein
MEPQEYVLIDTLVPFVSLRNRVVGLRAREEDVVLEAVGRIRGELQVET